MLSSTRTLEWSPVLQRVQPARAEPLGTGLEPFDRLLGGGLPRGDLVELSSARRGEGALALALGAAWGALSQEAQREGTGRGVLVVVDPRPELLLPARPWAVDLLLLRPRGAREALDLFDEVLRSRAVTGAILVDGPDLRLAQAQRLRHAARVGGGAALRVRHGRLGGASAAAASLQVRRVGFAGVQQRLEVEALRLRGRAEPGAPVVVSL